MPKCQVILEYDDPSFSSQEIEETISRWFNKRSCEFDDNRIMKFKFLYAQSLEGIKRELWEKKEELKKELEDHAMKSDSEIDSENYFIEKNFKAISDLFKLY